MSILSTLTTTLTELTTVVGGTATAIDTAFDDDGNLKKGIIPKSTLGTTTSTTVLYSMQEINYQLYLNSLSTEQLSALVEQVEQKEETLETEEKQISKTWG